MSKFLKRGIAPRSLRIREIGTGHPDARTEGGARDGLFEERAKRGERGNRTIGVRARPVEFGTSGMTTCRGRSRRDGEVACVTETPRYSAKRHFQTRPYWTSP